MVGFIELGYASCVALIKSNYWAEFIEHGQVFWVILIKGCDSRPGPGVLYIGFHVAHLEHQRHPKKKNEKESWLVSKG